LRFSWRRRFKS